jgi:hypothetical protein
VIAVFAATLVVLIGVYLVFSVPGRWFPGASTIGFSASQLSVPRGVARIDKDELVITGTDASGNALVSVTTDFRSSEYPAVAWAVVDLPGDAVVQMLWHTDFEPARLNSITLPVESGRLRPVLLARNPAWIGRVNGLALLIRGEVAHPIFIRGVAVKPLGVRDVLSDRLHEWFAFEGWTGTSINTVAGGSDFQDLPLPPLVALAIVLPSIALGAWAWKRPGKITIGLPAMIGGLFVVAWFALDARWISNLVRQVDATREQYAGKSWRDKHLAADDGALFAFIEKVREVLPREPARVFVASDEHYFRGRAAYHLYPHNVFYYPYQNFVPASTLMRPGDWLVVYQRRGVQYDAAQERLRWEGSPPIAAEKKLVQDGGALFLIR